MASDVGEALAIDTTAIPDGDEVPTTPTTPSSTKEAVRAPKPPPRPRLVRGHTSVPTDDHAALIALVVDALSGDPGWRAVDPAKVTVKDVSGKGGSKTFKISAPTVTDDAVDDDDTDAGDGDAAALPVPVADRDDTEPKKDESTTTKAAPPMFARKASEHAMDYHTHAGHPELHTHDRHALARLRARGGSGGGGGGGGGDRPPPRPNPPAVALHSSSAGNGQIARRRMGAAGDALAAHGLAPARLARGPDWHIEAWGGKNYGHEVAGQAAAAAAAKEAGDTKHSNEPWKMMTADEWARVGRLCAKIHAVPTTWIDAIEAEFRAELAASTTPSLAAVPRASHLWIFLFRGAFGLTCAQRLLPDRALRWPAEAVPCPELEGTWRPTRVDEWTHGRYQQRAKDPRTCSIWEAGRCRFQIGEVKGKAYVLAKGEGENEFVVQPLLVDSGKNPVTKLNADGSRTNTGWINGELFTSHWVRVAEEKDKDDVTNANAEKGEEEKEAEALFFDELLDPGATAPTHPLAARVVTVHGDFHLWNLVSSDDGTDLQTVDFEFTSAQWAVKDLGFAVGLAYESGGDRGARNARAFLRGYARGAAGGHAPSDDALDALAVDAMLAQLHGWACGGRLAAWDLAGVRPRSHALARVRAVKAFAADVRAGGAARAALLRDGLPKTAAASKHVIALTAKKLSQSKWYTKMQEELEAEGAAEADADGEDIRPRVVVLRAQHAQHLVLQVRPGTDRLELAERRAAAAGEEQDGAEPDPNQTWRYYGDGRRVEHVATGLCLDAAVKYVHMRRGCPWETCGGVLRVRARAHGSGADRQRWLWDGDAASGMLRHFIDGRSLDVNFWRLESGTGVNVNIPHTSKYGCSWVMETVGGEDGAPAPDLSAVAPPFPAAVLASAPDGAEVFIKSAKSRGFCLSVRSDGYTGDRAEVYLAKIDAGCAKQRWTVVDGNMLRNVESGEFLDSDVKYPCCGDASEVWSGNHTDLRTRPRDDAPGSANQRWVFDEDHRYFGGYVLRHFRDGRGVDVHGWKTDNDGNNVGVENSVHVDCRGIVYILSASAEEEE